MSLVYVCEGTYNSTVLNCTAPVQLNGDVPPMVELAEWLRPHCVLVATRLVSGADVGINSIKERYLILCSCSWDLDPRTILNRPVRSCSLMHPT